MIFPWLVRITQQGCQKSINSTTNLTSFHMYNNGVAVAIVQEDLAKPAALLFDKIAPVAYGAEPFVPRELDCEISAAIIPGRLVEGSTCITVRLPQTLEVVAAMKAGKQVGDLTLPKDDNDRVEMWAMLGRFYAQCGVTSVPILTSEAAFHRDFEKGSTDVYSAILANIPLVSPSLSWDHVIEFRDDPESVRKYRALRTWLADGLKATTHQEATDFIGTKLDDYMWAIKKHGLETKLGALTTALDAKELTVPAAGSIMTFAITTPMWALAAGGCLMGAKAALSMAKSQLKLEEIRRDNAAVATIYEIKQLITTGRR